MRPLFMWLAAGGAGLYVIALYLHDPSSGGFPTCPFRTLTGWSCPGCGSQRAIHELLHLRVAEAFRQNALLISSPVLLFVQGLYGRWVRGTRGFWMPSLLLLTWTVVLIAWGIVRNVRGW